MEVPEAEGNNTRRNYKGVYQTKSGNWVAKIYDRNARVTVHLGTFYTAEDAARAYDVAALKYQGEKARLNFPADPHVSCARKRVSKSLPVSRVEGQNHQSGLEQLQQEHQNAMLLQEQTKGVEETEYGIVSLGNKTGGSHRGVELKSSGNWAYDEAALKIHGHREMLNFPDPRVSYTHSAEHLSIGEKRRRVSESSYPMLLQEQTKEKDEPYVDSVYPGVGNIGQHDSSVKESEDALGFINSDGSIMSFLMAALEEESVHQTFPDQYIVQPERNVADLTRTRIEYPSRDNYRQDSVTSRDYWT